MRYLLFTTLVLITAVGGAVLPRPFGACVLADENPAAVKRAQAELERCVDKHVSALVTLARRLRKKDEDTAIRALQRAFSLRPGCSAAQKVARQMHLPDLEHTVFLFDGSGVAAWKDSGLPVWSMDGEWLRGDAPTGSYITWSYETFEGDYTVRMEARVAKEYDGTSVFSLGGDTTDPNTQFVIGLISGDIQVAHRPGQGKPPKVAFRSNPAEMHPPLDPTEWAWYELRFEGDRVAAYFNGTHVADASREGGTGGSVSISVQHVALMVRRVEVVRH